MSNKPLVTMVSFELPDPLHNEREKFVLEVGSLARMAALDATRAETDEVRNLCCDVAHDTVSIVLSLIDGDGVNTGYYLMPHNSHSRETPNLSGVLSELFDAVNT
jgi:hypothetical protein